MNRYDLFRLFQELGQLIEGVKDKSPAEAARALIDYGNEKLTEAEAFEALSRPINGTATPVFGTDPVPLLGPNDSPHPAPASVSADASQA